MPHESTLLGYNKSIMATNMSSAKRTIEITSVHNPLKPSSGTIDNIDHPIFACTCVQ